MTREQFTTAIANANSIVTCTCKNRGTLILNSYYDYCIENDGTLVSTSGNLADYSFSSAKSMHAVASGYDYVIRRRGVKIEGVKYTLRMAQHDFKSYINGEEYTEAQQ